MPLTGSTYRRGAEPGIKQRSLHRALPSKAMGRDGGDSWTWNKLASIQSLFAGSNERIPWSGKGHILPIQAPAHAQCWQLLCPGPQTQIRICLNWQISIYLDRCSFPYFLLVWMHVESTWGLCPEQSLPRYEKQSCGEMKAQAVLSLILSWIMTQVGTDEERTNRPTDLRDPHKSTCPYPSATNSH